MPRRRDDGSGQRAGLRGDRSRSGIFWFPRARILVTGDLFFYRPGRPATGRAKKLCSAVASLGLDVERFVVSWPLSGYGTKNIFSRAEFDAACAAAP